MGREARQLKILELIAKHDIDTQDELVARLKDEGFGVTQATVSRDVKDMGIIKTMSSDGKRYKYVAAQPKDAAAERFISVFRNTVTSIRCAENLVVVKTETGSANAAAETIDRLHLDSVLGVIAGDNTIFVAVENGDCAKYVAEKLEDILK